MANVAEELNRFKGKTCKIYLTNGKMKVSKIKRADSVSIALDNGDGRNGNETAIMLTSIMMIKIEKEEKTDEKKA